MPTHDKLRIAILAVARHCLREPAQPEDITRLTPDGAAHRDKLRSMMETFSKEPDLRRHMIPWMVDFEGGVEPHEHEPVSLQVRASYAKVHDDVRAFCDRHGLRITDSGSGRGGWHIGAPCSDEEAARVWGLAMAELEQHLVARSLTRIKIWFCGWRFRDFPFMTAGAARELLGAS